MKSLKNTSVKLFAAALLIASAAGCASVTDATVSELPEPVSIDQPANPAPEGFGIGDDVQPILDRPEEE